MWGRGRLPLVIFVAFTAGCSARGLSISGSFPDDGSGGGNGNGGGSGNGGTGGSGGGHGGSGGLGGGGGPAGPRLVAPLSTVTVTSRRPRLRWDMNGVSGAASVDLCADRACATLVGGATVDASGGAATPDAELPAGALFWRVRAGGATSATWELFVGHRSAPVDNHFGATLDLDGDGIADVAAASQSGVAVYAGGASGLGGAPVMLPNPDGAGANFGYVVAAAGDLNGDGYGDLAVGECGGKAPGVVHVYFGGPGGAQPAAAQTLKAPDGTSGFGCRLAAAGDLDGDGYGDLAIARTGEDFSGGLYIYRGGPGGLPATSTRLDSPDYKPSRLGYSLAGVGDLDGDGYDDLVASEIDSSARSGRAHVYRGGPNGISNANQTTILSPDASGLQFGASVAGVGDVDGDGYPDFAIASPSVSTTPLQPTVHVYRGGTGGIGKSIDLATNGATGFAGEVEPAGDVDGDGYSDVVVSSPSTLTIYRGGAAGLAVTGSSIDAAGQGTNPRHLAGAGDLDGDGRCDVVVGDGAGVEALFGSAGGVDRARVMTVSPPSGASGSVT